MLRSSKWSLSLRFTSQNPVCPCSVSHVCYIPNSCHYSLFYPPHNVWGGVYRIYSRN
jgi:hypothetical protein